MCKSMVLQHSSICMDMIDLANENLNGCCWFPYNDRCIMIYIMNFLLTGLEPQTYNNNPGPLTEPKGHFRYMSALLEKTNEADKCLQSIGLTLPCSVGSTECACIVVPIQYISITNASSF